MTRILLPEFELWLARYPGGTRPSRPRDPGAPPQNQCPQIQQWRRLNNKNKPQDDNRK